MQFERDREWWENIRLSLGFLPMVIAVIAVILGLLMPEVDSVVPQPTWLFSQAPDAARTALSVIAGSLITVISLLFSIMILTLQQASTQFSPRIIRNFTSDRGNQLVLGMFIGTFIYALLVLRVVQGGGSSSGQGSVPILSLGLAYLLTLACIGLLVYFIHHSSTQFEAMTVVERVHQDLISHLRKLYPEQVGEPRENSEHDFAGFRREHPTSESVYVTAETAGYIRTIDTSLIIGALPDGAWAVVHPQIGHYVTRNQPLVEVGGLAEEEDDSLDRLHRAFVFGRERTLPQDEMYGIRQLVDIALKALSPAVNSPTTAEHALSCLGDALTVLADRPLPSPERVTSPAAENNGDREVVLWLNTPTFQEFVETAFGQIRRVSRDQVHVLVYMLDVIGGVARQTTGDRTDALAYQIDEIVWQAEHGAISPADLSWIRERADAARRLLASDPLPTPDTG